MLISLNQFKIFCRPVRGGGRGCGGTRGGGCNRHPDCTHLGARNQKTAAPLGVAVGGDGGMMGGGGSRHPVGTHLGARN